MLSFKVLKLNYLKLSDWNSYKTWARCLVSIKSVNFEYVFITITVDVCDSGWLASEVWVPHSSPAELQCLLVFDEFQHQ